MMRNNCSACWNKKSCPCFTNAILMAFPAAGFTSSKKALRPSPPLLHQTDGQRIYEATVCARHRTYPEQMVM